MKHEFIVPRDNTLLLKSISQLDKPHILDMKPFRQSRSLAQNSLFHVWCRECSQMYTEAGGEWLSPDIWKEHFKRMFLGVDSAVIKGRIVEVYQGTSDLNTEEFSAFLESIDNYCGSELGIILPRPIDYDLAMYGEESGDE